MIKRLLKALTFIEWIIVVAIVGILTAVIWIEDPVCDDPPTFVQVAGAASLRGKYIIGLDAEGRAWVKTNRGCWEQQ